MLGRFRIISYLCIVKKEKDKGLMQRAIRRPE